MFKTNFRILLQDWTEIYSYKSRIKPSKGEFIWVQDHEKYYKVVGVSHSTKYNEVILIVDFIKNSGLKDLHS
jgi:hypothetical protein